MSALPLRACLAALLGLLVIVDRVAAQQEAPATGSTPRARSPQFAGGESSQPLEAFSAVGSDMALANHLGEMGWSEAQVSAFIDGIRAAFQGKPYPPSEAARQISDRIRQQIEEIESRKREEEFAKPGRLEGYLKEVCKRLKLTQSDSGLCYAIQPGSTGSRPGPDDTVVVSCAAYAADFATPLPQLSSQNARTRVSDMLPGFVEGIQMMAVGGKAIFVLPPELSFGSSKWPQGVDRGTPLIFRIALTDVISGSARH
jgi:FKBP-type peptidyl-prolyl cis-trans isomerase FkpA